jgi:hypothetical protein
MLQGKDNLSELLNVPVRFHVLIRGLVHLVKEISDTFPCDSWYTCITKVFVELIKDQTKAAAQTGGIRWVTLHGTLKRFKVLHPLHQIYTQVCVTTNNLKTIQIASGNYPSD